jgi:hypothetical protein
LLCSYNLIKAELVFRNSSLNYYLVVKGCIIALHSSSHYTPRHSSYIFNIQEILGLRDGMFNSFCYLMWIEGTGLIKILWQYEALHIGVCIWFLKVPIIWVFCLLELQLHATVMNARHSKRSFSSVWIFILFPGAY